jgi:hypothetical protein
MYAHYWDLVLPHFQTLQRSLATPFAWDTKQGKFALIKKPKYYAKLFNILSSVIFVHCALVGFNLLQTLRNETNMLITIISLGCSCCIFYSTLTLWMHKTKASNLIQFLNRMAEYERSSIRLGNVIYTLYFIKVLEFKKLIYVNIYCILFYT